MNRLSKLLVIIGGVLAAFTATGIRAPLPVIIIGGLCLGMSWLLSSCVYGGNIWGIKIDASGSGRILSISSALGMIIGGYGAVTALICVLSFNIVDMVTSLIAFVLPLVVGPFIAKKITDNLVVAKSKNALVLDNLQIFKDVEGEIGKATSFVVGFEGVALFSSTNYCYAIYRYEDYELGELTTPQEVALVGTYFVQKYHDEFNYKVDVEVIPGEPGQTVVAVGTGGVGVARIEGTPDQRLFRSYIFSKK